MNTPLIRQCLVAGALVASYGITNVAHGSEEGDREIPTQLINVPDADDLNGACSKCRVNSLKAAQDATQDGATLEIYYNDERGELHGVIELTILLSNGQYRTETLEGVEVLPGESLVFELEGGEGWSWGPDVEHVWVEVLAVDG